MSRKRSLKKQQKRHESILERLEELSKRGADDELLAQAAEQAPEIAASAFGPKWAAAADRALEQSLARADFGRLERLLLVLRRSGPLQPLARLGSLGETVLDLAAGRCEAARSRLTAPARLESEAGEAFPRGLAVALQALAEEKTDGDPGLQAVRSLFRSLQSLEARAFEPTTLDRRSLACKLEAARQALATAETTKNTEQGRLFDNAGRCLSILDDLVSLENKLAQLAEGQVIAVSTAWLRGSGRLLAQILIPSGPPLLAPLRHAVHRRWRAVLERVKAREGPPGLAALCAAHPDLLAHDVDLPGGIPGSLAGLRQWEQARRLLAARNFKDLAGLLRSRSRSTSASAELAVLWSLELWACNHGPADEEDGDEEADLFDDFTAEPPGHRTLVRLEEMAGEIKRRFAAEQRAAVAQALRAKLFDLSEQTHLCDHAAGAALFLLEHQPGDVGLLIVGVTGAVTGESPRALRSLETQISRAGKAQAGDRALVERLMIQAGREAPGDVARILTTLKPLFTAEAWPEVTALVARETAWMVSRPLLDACMETMQGLMSRAGSALAEARADLELLRPLLAGTPGFAAMELAIGCWLPDPHMVERRLEAFLAADPGIENALTALQVLEKVWGPWTPSGADVAYYGLAHAVIDRIDRRGRGEIAWQLWYHAAPLLAFFADDSHRQRLDKKIRQILSSPELPGEDREKLNRALQAVQNIAAKRAERRAKPPRAKRKKSRRGRAGAPQLLLDLPWQGA
jgi:hypothetical protein